MISSLSNINQIINRGRKKVSWITGIPVIDTKNSRRKIIVLGEIKLLANISYYLLVNSFLKRKKLLNKGLKIK